MDSILANESNIYLSDFRNTYFSGFDLNQFIDHSIFIKSIKLKAEDFALINSTTVARISPSNTATIARENQASNDGSGDE